MTVRGWTCGVVISGLLAAGGCTGMVTGDPEFNELRPGNGGEGAGGARGGSAGATDAQGGRDGGLDGSPDGTVDRAPASGTGGSGGSGGAGGSAGSGGAGGSAGSGGAGGSAGSGGRDASADRDGSADVGGTGGSAGSAGAGTGGRGGTGGSSSTGGAGGSGGSSSSGGTGGTWRLANLTTFTSYPDPGSEECIEYNGCTWAGQFAFLSGTQAESWVKANNIAAIHSKDAATYRLKTLRVRQGTRQIDVKVYDMCSDSDCSGCCTANSKQTGFLIDLEKYTTERFGSSDGVVEWMCLDCP
jgi:hypothetical protein